MNPLLQKLGLRLPIIQAPMAGASTPAMAAAVSNAGALGSIGIGAADTETSRQMIEAVRAASNHAFNVNVFCNRPAVADPAREQAWLERLAPRFADHGATRPPP
jgi:nitronate monooxygenase